MPRPDSQNPIVDRESSPTPLTDADITSVRVARRSVLSRAGAAGSLAVGAALTTSCAGGTDSDASDSDAQASDSDSSDSSAPVEDSDSAAPAADSDSAAPATDSDSSDSDSK